MNAKHKSLARAKAAAKKTLKPQPAQRPAAPSRARFFGVHSATVTDVRDPLGLGRVQVVVLEISEEPMWARLATLMAGDECGTWFIPSVGDEVLVAFAAGELNLPCVLGSLWNGASRPPVPMDAAGQNYKRTIQTSAGLKITFEDQDASLTLETRGGHKLILSDSSESISITDLNGNKIRMEAGGITITAAAKLKLEASSVEIAAGTLQLNTPMCKASGVMQCDTLIANSVIAQSYTPGAGNIW